MWLVWLERVRGVEVRVRFALCHQNVRDDDLCNRACLQPSNNEGE